MLLKKLLFTVICFSLTIISHAQSDTTKVYHYRYPPMAVAAPFGFGAGITGGLTVLTPEFSRNFSPVVGAFELMASFYYNRIFAEVGIQFFEVKNTHDFVVAGRNIEKNKVSLITTPRYALFGYDLAKSEDWRIAPFLGYTTLKYRLERDIYTPDLAFADFMQKEYNLGSTGLLVERLFGSFKDKKTVRYAQHGLGTTSFARKNNLLSPF